MIIGTKGLAMLSADNKQVDYDLLQAASREAINTLQNVNQNQFDALVVYIYKTGIDKFKESKLYAALTVCPPVTLVPSHFGKCKEESELFFSKKP